MQVYGDIQVFNYHGDARVGGMIGRMNTGNIT